METPPALRAWLAERCERRTWHSVRESRTVEEHWERHTGGRIMSAGLSASIEPASNFELAIEADDVEPEFIAAAKNGAITILMSQSWSPVLAVRLRLFDFKPHEVESSYAAFYNVAHKAALRLLGASSDSEFNIAWAGE